MTNYVVSAAGDDREMVSSSDRAVEIMSVMPEGTTSLSLSGKSYSPEAAKAILEYFSEKSHLRSPIVTLSIADTLGRRPEKDALATLEHLCEAFAPCEGIETVDISDNALGAKGVIASKKLISNRSKLTKIIFRNNGLNADAMKLISELLLGDDEMSKLKSLCLTNNLLESPGAIEASELVKKSPDLEEYIMTSTRVGREGSIAISKALSTCKNLRHIDVSDNTFGLEGSEALAETVKTLENLEKVVFKDLSVEDEGMLVILEGLTASKSKIKTLDISTNELTPDVCTAIASFLASKPTLEKLIVDENELGTEGVLKLAKAMPMENLENLRELSLADNGIGKKGALELGRKAKEFPALKLLNLNANSIADDAVEELTSMLESILGSMEDNLGDDDEDEEEDDEDGDED